MQRDERDILTMAGITIYVLIFWTQRMIPAIAFVILLSSFPNHFECMWKGLCIDRHNALRSGDYLTIRRNGLQISLPVGLLFWSFDIFIHLFIVHWLFNSYFMHVLPLRVVSYSIFTFSLLLFGQSPLISVIIPLPSSVFILRNSYERLKKKENWIYFNRLDRIYFGTVIQIIDQYSWLDV